MKLTFTNSAIKGYHIFKTGPLKEKTMTCMFQIAKMHMWTFLLTYTQAANSAKVTKIWRYQNVVNQVVLLHFSSNKKLI